MWYNAVVRQDMKPGRIFYAAYTATTAYHGLYFEAPCCIPWLVLADSVGVQHGASTFKGKMNNSNDWAWRSQVYKQVERESGLQYYEWRQLRDTVLERDGFRCKRCDVKFRYKKYLTVHHIISRADGGTNAPDNLITLCGPCHNYVELRPELNNAASIAGSVDTPITMNSIEEIEDTDSEDRPDWHKYVYGGVKKNR